MNTTQTFILIDDDPVNNFICKEFIKFTIKTPYTVLDFTDPEKGLEYIVSKSHEYSENSRTILFLDINMPTMTGWEFLEKFSQLEENIIKKITIFIMSSSINPLDMQKANSCAYVSGFIVKPISEDLLLKISA